MDIPKIYSEYFLITGGETVVFKTFKEEKTKQKMRFYNSFRSNIMNERRQKIGGINSYC